MTTLHTSEHRQGLPAPCAYPRHVDRVLEAQWRAERRRRRWMRRLYLLAFASIIFLAVVLYLRLT